ncbi:MULTISPECIES: YjfB family protein [Gracilibacillus]|uniref:Putative motility protein n=1 Tax=Gracilibacillus dipsosauri TaxID=178340 RepID=A0A317L0E0_9BACI|nr:YjfB family protein [Gracilibacillus dipsosauri]PWU69287.1 putative motility protein [Gracilibacillus dipsosauri]
MDIAAMSIAMNQAQVKQEASIAVLKKAINEQQVDSNEMIKMLEQSMQPHLGSSIDIKG